ncbi:MAG TPA: universal stress protein [Polyangiaceae bacterium]|nr:universal stress protein [Polyangiaceae bacterium]
MTDTNPVKKPHRIVVGFDFSELGDRALLEAFEIARHRAPADLHVITVGEPAGTRVLLPRASEPVTEEVARETVRLRVAKLVDEDQAKRGPLGIERVAVYVMTGVPAGEPGQLIVDLANAVDADLIVVGTHGRTGLVRAVLGSVASRVVRDATTSVYVVRPGDFVRGEPVPAIEPPLPEGAPHLKHFEHRRTYHYVDKVSNWTSRTMPAS